MVPGPAFSPAAGCAGRARRPSTAEGRAARTPTGAGTGCSGPGPAGTTAPSNPCGAGRARRAAPRSRRRRSRDAAGTSPRPGGAEPDDRRSAGTGTPRRWRSRAPRRAVTARGAPGLRGTSRRRSPRGQSGRRPQPSGRRVPPPSLSGLFANPVTIVSGSSRERIASRWPPTAHTGTGPHHLLYARDESACQ